MKYAPNPNIVIYRESHPICNCSQAALYGNTPNTGAGEKINAVLNVLRARRAACERPELSGVHYLARRRFPPANQTLEPNYPGGGQTSLPATGIIPLNSGRWAPD
jgi:hypothetical protein